jgi:pimeloyl-ACP methyl ester carboxylesterase
MLDLADWFATGFHVGITLPRFDQTFEIFCRVEGDGPWLTFLHGFPTCSWDWAKISGRLKSGHRLLMFDFLGFGDSSKPRKHNYDLMEQAHIVEAVWKHFQVGRTGVVAHNYGVSVAQELLARQTEGSLSAALDRMAFLNGGLYSDYHRARPIQTWLGRPVVGSLLARLVTERAFATQFSAIFSKDHPVSAVEIHQHWEAIQRGGGIHVYHRLIRYLADRRTHKARWEAALESSPIPLHFVWGMLDPVSGAPMAEHIHRRLPRADFLELADVGHYPQLEVPETVSARLVEIFG